MTEPGFFITFEGGEGAGKSTQIQRLARKLREKAYEVLLTREPGGSQGAEAVRTLLLSGVVEPIGLEMEALLFAAARSDHLDQLIRPAIARGVMVLCDRFVDSSRVYQGTAEGIDPAFMKALERSSVGVSMPDLTLVFDLDPIVGLKRAAARRGNDQADRFEKETIDTHRRRREAFLAIARSEPRRCVVIDAARDIPIVENDVTDAVFAALAERTIRSFQRVDS